MTKKSVELFATELLAQLFIHDYITTESDLVVTLYDKAAERERYSAFYDAYSDRYVVCKATKWDINEEDVHNFGYAMATELTHMEDFEHLRDAAGFLVEIAIAETLLPVMDYSLPVDNDDS